MNFDIDIDFADRSKALALLRHVRASLDGQTAHNTGVYFHSIPTNPWTGAASISYREAEERGYFKVDFLNNSVYYGIETEFELDILLSQTPAWELLEHREFVEQLAHIGNHFDVVDWFKPTTLEELAVVLALIRPGKRHLLFGDRKTAVEQAWTSADGYQFKKAHAVSYAAMLIVQMNKLASS